MGALAVSPAPLGPPVFTAERLVRAAQAAVMPWDPTLNTIVDYLTGPALHTITWIALVAAALEYALGGEFDGGVRRLLRVGVGLLLASHAMQIMNFLFG